MEVLIFGVLGIMAAIVINEVAKTIKEKRNQRRIAARAAARKAAK